MAKKHPQLYDGYVNMLSKKISLRLETMAAHYSFENGDEFEFALCDVLRSFLPIKYGICRGYVVDREGTKEGDDIIIYDQLRFPTLRLNDKNQWAMLERIPIEAVYAYIEAKHLLNYTTLKKGFQQCVDVKKLISTRDKRKLYQFDPYIPSDLELPSERVELPKYRNPPYALIFSRYAVGEKGRYKSDDPIKIKKFLDKGIGKLKMNPLMPEIIVAGDSNLLFTNFYHAGTKNKQTTGFTLEHQPNLSYFSWTKPYMAYGIALAGLMSSLDWIRLYKMPWEDIINDPAQLKH